MMTIKDLMENPCRSSLDGKYWEPALPEPNFILWRLRDAWVVFKGNAIAVRQTTKSDLIR